jgi:hypothetical protein
MNKIYLVEAKHHNGFKFIVGAYFQKKNAEEILKLIEETKKNPENIPEKLMELAITSCDLKFMGFGIDDWVIQDFPEEQK